MERIWQMPGRTNLRTFAPLQSPWTANREKPLQALFQRRRTDPSSALQQRWGLSVPSPNQTLYRTNTDCSVLAILVKSLFKRFADSGAMPYIRGCAQTTRAGRVIWEALWTPAMSL